MSKFWLTLGAVAAAGLAFGQGVVVYNPTRQIKDQGIAVKSWGSGTVSETDELAYEGTWSIRVSTRNYFQGGTLSMSKPVELASAYGDRNNLLRFAIRIADSGLTLGGGGGGRGAGGGLGAPGGDGGGLGAGATGGAGAGAGAGGGQSSSADAEVLRNLRVVFTTSDGKKSEIYLPVTTARNSNTWLSVAVPLQAITGFDKTNKTVSAIAISGDATSTFYVGDIRLINDSTPVTGDMSPNQDRNLALGDEVEFRGRGFAGSSVLKYTWDFDATDGIQEDAEGQVIKRRFRKAGTYTVTLTVSDVYGLKKSYSTSIKVKVNP